MKRTVILSACCLLLATLIGCDAFVRKFTRKPKKQEAVETELVLVPEEYKGPQMTKEQLYRQYLMFWKSWQDELIKALAPQANHKKQIDCAEEAIKNLMNMKSLLGEVGQPIISTHIDKSADLKESIVKDPYGMMVSANRSRAEALRRNILRDCSPAKMKKELAQ